MRLNAYVFASAALALTLSWSSGGFADDAAAAPDKRQALVEARIRDMYATLKITKEQDADWNAFAQVMLDNAQAMDATAKQDGGDRDKMSAPENLNRYASIAERHAQNVSRMAGAMQMLYADLTPQQKEIADDMFRHGPPKPESAAKK
ncbi:MAG: Spy/CpxP family protein refolding chaperone [Pseudomonadota bacterium]|nr:Spy/CpxP family protein refolding chaperone [Pseudomonadota bacterium]